MKKICEFKKGHIVIVEKAKETSLDTGMHNRALLCYMNSGCVLECRDTPTSHSPTLTHIYIHIIYSDFSCLDSPYLAVC